MIELFKKNKKLPEGTKEQGGFETFKFKAAYNNLEKKFYISLTSRKTFHTARLNISAEEFKEILDGMVIAYEDVVYPNTDMTDLENKPYSGESPVEELRPPVDPDDEMKAGYEGYENIP